MPTDARTSDLEFATASSWKNFRRSLFRDAANGDVSAAHDLLDLMVAAIERPMSLPPDVRAYLRWIIKRIKPGQVNSALGQGRRGRPGKSVRAKFELLHRTVLALREPTPLRGKERVVLRDALRSIQDVDAMEALGIGRRGRPRNAERDFTLVALVNKHQKWSDHQAGREPSVSTAAAKRQALEELDSRYREPPELTERRLEQILTEHRERMGGLHELGRWLSEEEIDAMAAPDKVDKLPD